MQGRLVFLLEEPSMKNLLEQLLPRLFPGWVPGQHFLCVPHEGKSDLDRSIPRKLEGWRVPYDRFVIVRDNDNADGKELKSKFVEVCKAKGRPDTLVRLVCQELEAWYLGDLQVLAQVFKAPQIDSPAMRKKFHAPDEWQKPSIELARIVPSFQKGSGARLMGQALRLDDNKSRSFQVFIDGIRRITKEMEALTG